MASPDSLRAESLPGPSTESSSTGKKQKAEHAGRTYTSEFADSAFKKIEEASKDIEAYRATLESTPPEKKLKTLIEGKRISGFLDICEPFRTVHEELDTLNLEDQKKAESLTKPLRETIDEISKVVEHAMAEKSDESTNLALHGKTLLAYIDRANIAEHVKSYIELQKDDEPIHITYDFLNTIMRSLKFPDEILQSRLRIDIGELLGKPMSKKQALDLLENTLKPWWALSELLYNFDDLGKIRGSYIPTYNQELLRAKNNLILLTKNKDIAAYLREKSIRTENLSESEEFLCCYLYAASALEDCETITETWKSSELKDLLQQMSSVEYKIALLRMDIFTEEASLPELSQGAEQPPSSKESIAPDKKQQSPNVESPKTLLEQAQKEKKVIYKKMITAISDPTYRGPFSPSDTEKMRRAYSLMRYFKNSPIMHPINDTDPVNHSFQVFHQVYEIQRKLENLLISLPGFKTGMPLVEDDIKKKRAQGKESWAELPKTLTTYMKAVSEACSHEGLPLRIVAAGKETHYEMIFNHTDSLDKIAVVKKVETAPLSLFEASISTMYTPIFSNILTPTAKEALIRYYHLDPVDEKLEDKLQEKIWQEYEHCVTEYKTLHENELQQYANSFAQMSASVMPKSLARVFRWTNKKLHAVFAKRTPEEIPMFCSQFVATMIQGSEALLEEKLRNILATSPDPTIQEAAKSPLIHPTLPKDEDLAMLYPSKLSKHLVDSGNYQKFCPLPLQAILATAKDQP